MLEIKHIYFSYEREILHDVNFSLKKGQFLGIVGKSGGGKSSLLKVIAGLLTPQSGAVFLHGKKLKRPIEMLLPGYEQMSIVHQDFGLDLYHTVYQNVKQKVLHLPDKLQNKIIKQLLNLMDLGLLTNQKAIDLSGGEQQRLSIARSLACESELVLLDEPFVHLDASMRMRLINYLENLKEIRNTSFIIVTHNGDEILGLCDEVIYLKNGRIRRKASASDFYDKPKSSEEAEFFGPINSVTIENKRKLFRPNQYGLKKENQLEEVQVKFKRLKKQGGLFYNYFLTKHEEEILLINLEPMKEITCIYV